MIEVTGLSKRFQLRKTLRASLLQPFKPKKRVPALEAIDLHITRGEIFALLGPNGAGKTTLIKILCSLVLPDKGSVRIAGYNIETHPELVKSKIGLLTGEERSLYWRLTGRQNLEFFGALYSLSKKEISKRINELNEIMQIDDLDKPFEAYSSGMKIRVGLTRCLLNDPDLLILDEPTRSLDPIGAENLRTFMSQTLAKQMGKTIFFTTHQTEEASCLADRMAIINHGKLITCGRLSEIRTYWGFHPEASLKEIYLKVIHNG